ncbi:MAG: LarC family nickel insertion protein [Oscillospiraceae bacterium]|nr:LarC family nickel insertion protein [Oscillospiraceae bacterium]
MKTLYFECNMGAAGDMLMSALTELIPEPSAFIEKLNNIGIPNVKIERNTVSKCGISGTEINVFVHGHEEDENMHEHHHREHHTHCHTGIKEVREIINGLDVSDKIKADASAVYDILAAAESHVHGRPVEQIHFHEIGTMDAVVDIVGVCMLMDEIKPDVINTSHIHVGSGQVKCAHGLLPVPAPATAHILQGVPTYGGEIKGELCTPTGAALLKYFTDNFVKVNSMTVEKIGYGTGKRRFYDDDGTEILSAVRAMLGETDA